MIRHQPPAFRSNLRPLSIIDYERMSPQQRQHREKLEEDERRDWLDKQRNRPKPARRP
jgi:hypothetical protein